MQDDDNDMQDQLDKSFNNKHYQDEEDEEIGSDFYLHTNLDNLLVEESNPQTESDKIRQSQMQ